MPSGKQFFCVFECFRKPGISGEHPGDFRGPLIFVKPDGSWIHPQSFSQVLDRKVAKLDVPTISLHDLRHTHATLLLKAGVHVKIVSERLGHANVAFTMSVYQHVLPGMQAEAAATFAGLIGRGAIDWNDFVPPSDEASSESEGGQR